jgi:hypothetical protein
LFPTLFSSFLYKIASPSQLQTAHVQRQITTKKWMVNEEYVKDLHRSRGVCQSQGCNYHISRVCKAQGPTNIQCPRALPNKVLFVHELNTTHYYGKFEHIRGNPPPKRKVRFQQTALFKIKHGVFAAILHKVAMYLMHMTGPIGKLCKGAEYFRYATVQSTSRVYPSSG